MAEERISVPSVDVGRAFLEKLDEFGLYPESAGWLYAHGLGDWRYIVATSAIDVVGRRKIYSEILDIFDTYDFGPSLTEADVHLVSPNEEWYALMRGFFQFSGGPGSHASFHNCIINGQRLDGFVYRFFAPPNESILKRQSERFAKNARKALEHVGR